MEEWRKRKIESVYAKWEKKAGKSSQNGHSRSTKPLVIRSSRYNGAASRYNRQRQKKEFLAVGGFGATATFLPSLGVDLSALHAAANLKYVSIRQSCEHCLPVSRVDYHPKQVTETALYNCLVVDSRKYGVFGRWCPYISHSWRTVMNYSMRDMRKDILQAKRIKTAIEDSAKTTTDNDPVQFAASMKEQEKRARLVVNRMSSGVYNGLVRIVAWALLWVFGRLYNKIQTPKKHISMLLKAQERGIPIVFLPSHKSHMDYIIMTFILLNMGIHIPRIAAGDNLRIPLISWLVTHLGGFFIKRKLDSASGKDVLYRKCLHEFMEHSLSEGENMEFFIEGSRSRSGKPNTPKAGLLSILVECVREGIVADILLVPVGISYDMLIERNFVRHELMGGSKKTETFFKAMKGVWVMLTKNTGSVRIDFAQPFSLQEYLSSSFISSQSQLEVTNASHYRSVLSLTDLAQRKVVTALSHHIIHDMTHCASLMPTSMVSFLLLARHRNGATVTELISSYLWLEEIACKKQRSVGFTGEASEAVHYALHYLRPLLNFEENERTNGFIAKDQVIRPRLKLPDVFELLHHMNQVTPMLALEAVLACSLHSSMGGKLKATPHKAETLNVDKDELVEVAVYLCRILSREFIFAPPCVDLWQVLTDTVDILVNSDLLKMPPEPSTFISGRKLPRLFEDSDEEEGVVSIQLEVNTEEWALERLVCLQSILDPLLEAYWSTLIALLQMEHTMIESEFLKQLQSSLIQKAEKDLLRNVESCSMDSLRNALKCMMDLGYVGYKEGSLLYVTDFDKLTETVERITVFKN